MNAVLLSLGVLFGLSLLRVNVVLAMLVATLVGGLTGGLNFAGMTGIFTEGLKNSAGLALSYALLGAYAAGLADTGLPERLVNGAVRLISRKQRAEVPSMAARMIVLAAIALIACLSQNAIPVHIAFIPVLIPPLLVLFNKLRIDRRAAASALTFGLIAPYMLLPVGFGAIFHDTVATNMTQNGLTVDAAMLPQAMLLPTLGMAVGLVVALAFSYRKQRVYSDSTGNMVHAKASGEHDTTREEFVGAEKGTGTSAIVGAGTGADAATGAAIGTATGASVGTDKQAKSHDRWIAATGLGSVISMLAVQLSTGSMIYGAAAGLAVLLLTRAVAWKNADRVFTDGMRSMAYIGFVMMTAAGFGAVLRATGHINTLVEATAGAVGDNRALAAILMLAIGLLVTLGIGSSFSTVPIIATVFVPLCAALGFSTLATVALIGTAAALGDAGSPASDSTLGPTAGLNADGQHDHIWDTCVPTFLHYNIPLLIFGFIAAMVL
ncbi:Na+/H+ antiporter family protein [Paenibacillus sp. 481]|uniref:Na+/H+ antiporter family protein n=1 Tax=Paenibacillus sp. 481 TaxID=2835869 RepID=UPI001E613CD0|nr:Na+/H+ antiporter NhaC family protein [Paenibacillus sp. 481]UHA75585.1 sodium:proton antiporter [Paenibacillus sp. 481]